MSETPDDDRLSALLAQAARVDEAPGRALVPGAAKRLRLRRYAVTHTNEWFELFAGFARGLATLWSTGERAARPAAASKEDGP